MKVSNTAHLLFGFAIVATASLSQETAASPDNDSGVWGEKSFSQNLGKSTKFEKLEKGLKHLKDSKNSKSEKATKSEKKSKRSKDDVESYDDGYLFSDKFWEDKCFFNFGDVPNTNASAHCIEVLAENAYLYIDTDKALNCSESFEKAAWNSYPSCFQLMDYYPYYCEHLDWELDEAFDCLWGQIYEEPCYFDDSLDITDGCAINFANSVGLDVEKVLDCTVDLGSEFERQCYPNNYDWLDDDFYYSCYLSQEQNSACEILDQCEYVLWNVEDCSYNNDVDPSDVTNILEQELGGDFLETVYNGTVDIKEVLSTLQEYDGRPDMNETEWSAFAQCMARNLDWLADDSCFLEYADDKNIAGGCVQHFADSFSDLSAEGLFNCIVDFEEELEQKCYCEYNTNEATCDVLEACANAVYGIDDCMYYSFGSGFLIFADILAGTELSDIVPGIYDGSVDPSSVLERITDLSDAFESDDSTWEEFLACLEGGP